MEDDDGFEVDAHIIRITGKALLVRIGHRQDGTEEQAWIPRSHILSYDHDWLIVSKWLAQEKGWLEP